MPGFDSSFSVENLNAIVDSIIEGHFDVIEERPRISTGADRIELDHFLRDREKHLAAMSRKVLSGRFTFSPFLEREIPLLTAVQSGGGGDVSRRLNLAAHKRAVL